jgi:hypothetical protein
VPIRYRRFGLFRFRSPLLSESRFLSLPPGTEMVHFPGFAHTRLCVHRAVVEVHSTGFPHSEIPGSKPACGSPRLIAACHVFLRLLLPRHPPCALSSLIIKFTRTHQPLGCILLRELNSYVASLALIKFTTVTLIRLVYTNLFSCQTSSSSF